MDIIEETVERGVIERRFDLKVADDVVPGIHWLPEGATAPHATVLIGHGGTQHKRTPHVLGLARRLVRHLGVGAVALDAPEHGDRITDPEAAEAARQGLQQRIAEGRGGDRPPLGTEDRMRAIAERTPKHVAEWRALIDELQRNDQWANGPFGWWGVSMGTSHGLPLVAEEPRITAAVLGLNGVRPGNERMAELAAQVSVPVLFLFQWDDELMTRESGLALFDAFGTKQKTMHINPGGHIGMPAFERDAVEAFYVRNLRVA